MRFKTGIILASSILLTACGGGGGGGGAPAAKQTTPTTTPPTDTPSSLVQVSAKNGEMTLDWDTTDINGDTAACYRISIRQNENENYQELESCLTETSFAVELSVIDTDLSGLSYLVEACDGNGTCEDIESIEPEATKSDLIEKVTHISIPALDELGYSTYKVGDNEYKRVHTLNGAMLSEDESTMVYLFPYDASTDTGVYADPTKGRSTDDAIDAALPDIGAFAVAKKQNDQWVLDAFIKPPELEDSPFTKIVPPHWTYAFPTSLQLSANGDTIAVPLNTCGETATTEPGEHECISSILVYKREGGLWELTDNLPHSDPIDQESRQNTSLKKIVMSGDGNTILKPGIHSDKKFNGIINYPDADQIFGHIVETSYSDDYLETNGASSVVEVLYFMDHIENWVTQSLVSIKKYTTPPLFYSNSTSLNHDGNLITLSTHSDSWRKYSIVLTRSNDYNPTWKSVTSPALYVNSISTNASGSTLVLDSYDGQYSHDDKNRVFLRDGDNFLPFGELPPIIIEGIDIAYGSTSLDESATTINSTGDEMLIYFSCGDVCYDSALMIDTSYGGYSKLNITEFQNSFIPNTLTTPGYNEAIAHLHFKRVNSEWQLVGMLRKPYLYSDQSRNPYSNNTIVKFIKGGILAGNDIYR